MKTSSATPSEYYSVQLLPERGESPECDISFISTKGTSALNEDYVGIMLGSVEQRASKGSLIAVADGLSSGHGGRVAAELTVRSFIEGYYGLPDTLSPEMSASKALDAINRWLHQIGKTDVTLSLMAASFAALILRGQTAYLISVGDVRAYLLRSGELTQMSEDDVFRVTFGSLVAQAVGMQPNVVSKFRLIELHEGDRLLLCSDGLYRCLASKYLRRALSDNTSPVAVAHLLEVAARSAGSNDDVTAAVIDIKRTPTLDFGYLERVIGQLPILAVPASGDVVDDYKLGALLSDGFYSRVFVADDLRDGNKRLVVKFPKPRVESDQNIRQAVVRERWLSGKLHSAIVLAPLSMDPERQSRLYVVTPYCEGLTLEKLIEQGPVSLNRGLKIATQLGAAIQALNRLDVFHRDIKPENVLLTKAGELRLLDLGFSFMPGVLAPAPITPPGSPAYMAPELMRDQLGDRRSEVFAFGVTLYRAFSGGHLPYGLHGRVPLGRHCPDLPPWLDSVLEKAMHNDPESRYQDVAEVCSDLVRYAASGCDTTPLRRAPLIDRNPLLFWQLLAATLLLLLLVALAHVNR